ncbi:MAG: glycosyltransferase, partial [Bacteroidota bacterium]
AHPRRVDMTARADTPPISISLIVAVYNRPEALRFLLTACARQSFRSFELVAADDGSGPEVGRILEEAARTRPFPILHIRQEDAGWRKNAALNAAVRAARADYLVFTDGDCLPARRFLEDHWQEREPGRILLGRRVETSERWSRALTPGMMESGAFERYDRGMWVDGLLGRALRLEDGIRIGSRLLRRILLREVRGILGSNFSLARRDLEAVNGFDELYDGPGCGEDSDLQCRLSLAGVTGKSLRNLAIQYHLHHPRTAGSASSRERFRQTRELGQARCVHGLTGPQGPATEPPRAPPSVPGNP